MCGQDAVSGRQVAGAADRGHHGGLGHEFFMAKKVSSVSVPLLTWQLCPNATPEPSYMLMFPVQGLNTLSGQEATGNMRDGCLVSVRLQSLLRMEYGPETPNITGLEARSGWQATNVPHPLSACVCFASVTGR